MSLPKLIVVILHVAKMAIKDGNETFACKNIKRLVSKKKLHHELNLVFLMALIAGMESVVLAIIEKGFPSNMNHPIFGVYSKYEKSLFPSYFLLAITTGFSSVVKSMIAVTISLIERKELT